MKNKLLAPLLAFGIATGTATGFVTAFYAGVASAHADPVPVDAGTLDATPAPMPQAATGSAALPADQIHDPLSAPAATLDDAKAAKKLGWGVFSLFVLIVACRLLGRLGGIFKVLATGKVALGVAALGTLALTAYNAVLLGGSIYAGLMAGLVAGAAAWDSKAKPPESSSSSSSS